jgi:hypothetical protein
VITHPAFDRFARRVEVNWLTICSWFALVRQWLPWLAPRHGKTKFHLDNDAIMCAFLSPSGEHLVLLGISDVNSPTALFRSDDEGLVSLYVSWFRFNPPLSMQG